MKGKIEYQLEEKGAQVDEWKKCYFKNRTFSEVLDVEVSTFVLACSCSSLFDDKSWELVGGIYYYNSETTFVTWLLLAEVKSENPQ